MTEAKTILQNICEVFEIPVPNDGSSEVTIIKRATKAPEEQRNKFYQETRDYLEEVRIAMRTNKKSDIPLPPAITIIPPKSVLAPEIDDDADEEDEEADDDNIPSGIECRGTTKIYPADVLISKTNKADIVIPSFQRQFMWPVPQQQTLIDTMLEKLVIPEIWLAYENFGDPLSLIDGCQRVHTILAFYDNKFALGKKSAYYSEWAGKYFKDLPRKLQNRFLSYEFSIREIEAAQEHWPVIFARLNKGSKKATPMELRRGIFDRHPCIHFLRVLEEISRYNEYFLAMFGTNKRFGGQQALLRAKALHDDDNYANYTKPVERFLDAYCSTLKSYKKSDLKRLKADIEVVVTMLFEGIGQDVFRLESRGQVNAGLIDCMFHAGFLVLESGIEAINDVADFGGMLADTREQILANEDAKFALKQDTSNKASVIERMELTTTIIKGKIKYRANRANRMEMAPAHPKR